MRGYRPPRPTGSTPEARFDQALWDRVFGGEMNILPSSTVGVTHTPKGIQLKAAQPRGGGSSQVIRARVGVENDNTILCYRSIPNGEKGINPVIVAKPYVLRRTTYDNQLNPYGAVWHYLTVNTRYDNPIGGSSGEIITPPYFPGMELYIMPCDVSDVLADDGTPAAYIDLNVDARIFQTEIVMCSAYILMGSPFYSHTQLTPLPPPAT